MSRRRVRLLVLPGDGIGPEVTDAAVTVLRAVCPLHGIELDLDTQLIGGAAIDATGEALPADTLAAAHRADAVLLGAVGHPRFSPESPVRPEQGLLALRQALGLFANLRPIPSFPELSELTPFRPGHLDGADLLFVRELTGGLYFGPRREQGDGDEAHDTMVYRVEEVERVARLAFDAAGRRRGRVTSVDKANVLASSRLWRRTVDRVAADYPGVLLEHALVDSFAMRVLLEPARYDVVLTENLFGDILSDEAAVLAGSLGVLPSASLGATGPGLYEPVHGSAPDLAGRGVANPLGAILSSAMLLRYSLGSDQAATRIETAVGDVLAEGIKTRDLCRPDEPSQPSAEVTAAVIASLARLD